MTPLLSSLCRNSCRRLAMCTVLAGLTASSLAGGSASATTFTLGIGASDLVEIRTSQSLAPGLRLTRIVRGVQPTTVDQIPTTNRGPWRINVLSIDPALARGHVRATYGPDLARAEKVTDLVRLSGAVAGINASFFTYTANLRYPGEPRGLGLYRGAVLSEPAAAAAEVNLLVDAGTGKATIGRLTWRGFMRNRRTAETLTLEYLNYPPVVPSVCARLTDQTRCTTSGDVVHFTRHFGRSTPTGYGVETVLDRYGCLVRTQLTRGVVLAPGQRSIQATGRQTNRLLEITRRGPEPARPPLQRGWHAGHTESEHVRGGGSVPIDQSGKDRGPERHRDLFRPEPAHNRRQDGQRDNRVRHHRRSAAHQCWRDPCRNGQDRPLTRHGRRGQPGRRRFNNHVRAGATGQPAIGNRRARRRRRPGLHRQSIALATHNRQGGVDAAHQSCIDPSRRRLTGRYLGSYGNLAAASSSKLTPRPGWSPGCIYPSRKA